MKAIATPIGVGSGFYIGGNIMDYTMTVLIIITVINLNIALGLYIKRVLIKDLKKIIKKMME